ncbi:hypothetical protein JCM10207_006709 [Rhodosporidiobolus poonsookiae]
MSLLAAFSSTWLGAASPLFQASPLPARKASKPASQALFTGLSHPPIRAYGTLEATAIDLRILRWAKDVHAALSSAADVADEASSPSTDPLAHLVDPVLSPNVTVRQPRHRRAAPSPSSAASSRPSLLFDSPSSASASSCTTPSPSISASPVKATLPPVVRTKVDPLCPTSRRRSSPPPSPSSPVARLQTREMPARVRPTTKSQWR